MVMVNCDVELVLLLLWIDASSCLLSHSGFVQPAIYRACIYHVLVIIMAGTYTCHMEQ